MTTLSYNGQNIDQRESDNYVNLSQMAKANNVLVGDFNATEFAKNYLKALRESIYGESPLLVTQGFGAEKATWGHPLVAIAFGQWISPEFHVWCNTNIQTLITNGHVALDHNSTRTLPSRDATELTHTAISIESLNNCTLQQLLRDELIDELSIRRKQKQLPAAPKEYTIVKVRAKELGYSTEEIGNGTSLGKFVAKLIPIAFEERVGKYSTKHYEVSDELDTAIKSYFGMKHALGK